MMATSAAGDPPPPFPIGVPYAPTPEKEEALVFQASCPRYNKKPHPKWHGTQPAVAKSVANFPFRPPDNRRHEPSRSAAAAIVTAPPPATLTHSSSPSCLADAPSYEDPIFATCFNSLLAAFCPTLKIPTPSMKNPFSPLIHPSSFPTSQPTCPTTSTAAPRREST